MSQGESPSAVDTEKGPIASTNRRFKPSPDEEACHYLWTTYISQAQDYDKALLEGWKGDMDGMLLFSALYSATLTALLVESYQKLQEDPADATVTILTQISAQLALLSNGTVFVDKTPSPFELDTAYLVCNTFWFLSLVLALTCSLLATFVQQWTRDFLHKTTMRPSPIVQARVLAFSYFGLRRFGMHTFVDAIPILLHISLLFFFAGLVAFLEPINRPLTYLMACVLGVFFLVYTGLSCMPVVYLDAPYRTPVSDLIWRLGNRLRSLFLRYHNLPEDLTLTEAMLEASFKDSEDRDRQCMKFTMKSLNSDTELLPMFEAIPEAILRSSNSVRISNLGLIAPILQSPDPNENIISRISTFITISGQSANPEQERGDMETSLKALWSLARLVIEHGRKQPSSSTTTPVFWFDRSLLTTLVLADSAPITHITSALALIRTSRLQSIRHYVNAVSGTLATAGRSTCERFKTAKDIFEGVSLDDIHWTSEVFRQHFRELGSTLRDGCTTGLSETRAEELVTKARGHLSELQSPSRWKAALISVLGEFLSRATGARAFPFEMDLTYDLICTMGIPEVDIFQQTVEVEDDEANASLLLQNISPNSRDVPEKLFRLVYRLAFSTSRALLSRNCRETVIEYLYDESLVSWPVSISWDDGRNAEKCILQHIRTNDPRSSGPSVAGCASLIRTIYYSLGLGTSLDVSPRSRDFAMQLFELVPMASRQFTQVRWWNINATYTDWVLCKNILSKLADLTRGLSNNDRDSSPDLQIMDDIRSLGQRLLPEFRFPEYPSSGMTEKYKRWVKEIETYVMSVNLLIISKFTLINAENTTNLLLGDLRGMQYWLFNYSGHVYDNVQLQLAKSVHSLVSVHPWNQLENSPASHVFHQWIWCLSMRDWCWVTDVESARILLEAIQCHKNDQDFRGWIWFEQELFNRCMEVTRGAESPSQLTGG